MPQGFVRLLFDFTCSFVFMISVYPDVNSLKFFPYVSAIFLFADRWGTQSYQDDGGGLQHIGDIRRKWGDLKSQGHHVRSYQDNS